MVVSDSDDDLTRAYMCTVGWYDNPTNTSWRAGPDCERARRLPVVQAMFERFGKWSG